MGKTCSKCWKSNLRPLKESKPNISDHQIPKSSISNTAEEINRINTVTIQAKQRELIESHRDDKSREEQNPINDNNWDGYFTQDQLTYYRKILDSEYLYEEEMKSVHRYKKGELIGEGSYGKVYEGFDEDQGKLIAIKRIDLNHKKNRDKLDVNSVEIEVEILSKLHHKNIVKYYGVVRTEEYLDILLEYCIGGSVSKILKTYKSLSESIIKKYTIQILEGLEYLHCHNIIHSDIKGANILVEQDGSCKLSDFGGSKIGKEEIYPNNDSFKGTPNWMAPETIRNLENTRFSDIWSLGCTMIEMATGQPPWTEQVSQMAVMYALYNAKESPEIPRNISKDFRDFISRCLIIEPRERWNIYQLLRHPFISRDTTNTFFNKINEIKFRKDKNGDRIFDTLHSYRNSNKILGRCHSEKSNNEIIETSNIVIKSSPLSPKTKIEIEIEKNVELKRDFSNMTPKWEVINPINNMA